MRYKSIIILAALVYAAAFACAIAFTLSGCANFEALSAEIKAESGGYVPGTYSGSAQGNRGLIEVEVDVDTERINAIRVIHSDEDPFIGGAAMESLGDLVIEENSTEIDAVSGATESSQGFLDAVEDALAKARL